MAIYDTINLKTLLKEYYGEQTNEYQDIISKINNYDISCINEINEYIEEINEYINIPFSKKQDYVREYLSGNKDAKNDVININLINVVLIAVKYLGNGLSFSDLIQEGNIGLIQAVDRLDTFTQHYRNVINRLIESNIKQAIYEYNKDNFNYEIKERDNTELKKKIWNIMKDTKNDSKYKQIYRELNNNLNNLYNNDEKSPISLNISSGVEDIINIIPDNSYNPENAINNTVSSELISAIEALKEVSSSLRDYSSSLENDTERMNEIQERLFLLDKLKRKYGGSLEAVSQTGEKLRKELDSIEFSTQNIENLEKEIEAKKISLISLAQEISQERKNYATVLSSLIVEKLEKLELPKVKFEIGFEEIELCPNGIDKVEFLISTNISEELKPLAKVASGGEISRVMLAIKTIFAKADDIDTVIFDEIDTGISGKTSQSVADEVKELAQYMQIIMITHQAIIASKSDKHFYVRKTQNDTTNVNIYVLEGENKLKAIAELAAGEITDESMNFARTLVG